MSEVQAVKICGHPTDEMHCPFCVCNVLQRQKAELQKEREYLVVACEAFLSTIKHEDAEDELADLIMAADAIRLRMQGYPVDIEIGEQGE